MNDVERLVGMANQIGRFFAADSDEEAGAKAIAEHLKSFWHPNMRRQIVAHLAAGGRGLTGPVKKAVAQLSDAP